MSGSIMKTKILATLNGPEQRAEFEALLQRHGLGNKLMLSEEDLKAIALDQTKKAFEAGGFLIDAIATVYREELPRRVADEVKKDPALAEQVARWFMEAFKAAGPGK